MSEPAETDMRDPLLWSKEAMKSLAIEIEKTNEIMLKASAEYPGGNAAILDMVNKSKDGC